MENLLVVLNRRAWLASLASFGTIPSLRAEPAKFAGEWQSFKSRFMSEDGRIVDNGSGGVSHSEGQGWGMLFAVAAQDQTVFNLISTWTARMLRRPNDALHAWRYAPKDEPAVQDFNNATDGDMFIATALIRAGRLWARPEHLHAASAIGHDILRLLVRPVGSLKVLLPGVRGFETSDAVIVNPSYYAFPMMSELAKIIPSPLWGRLERDGRTLIEQGRFGRWLLPPDWLQIAKMGAGLSPAPGWPPRFSFDAIRVPLWWIWQKLPIDAPIRSVDQFWSIPPPGIVPAWADLRTNEVAPYAATPGMIAIHRLIRLASGGPDEPSALTVADASGYYDAALIMLSTLVEQEMLLR